MQLHRHTAIIYVFIFYFATSAWCMEDDERSFIQYCHNSSTHESSNSIELPVVDSIGKSIFPSRLDLIRQKGLRWYLLHTALPAEAVERIMHYAIPEIPHKCKWFWMGQKNIQEIKHTRTVVRNPDFKITNGNRIYINCDAIYINNLFTQYNIAMEPNLRMWLCPNKKFMFVVIPPPYGSFLSQIYFCNIQTHKLIRSGQYYGKISRIAFNNTSSLMTTRGWSYHRQQTEFKLIDPNNFFCIAVSYLYGFSLPPLCVLEQLCANPTYEQVQLLLSYTNKDKKVIANNTKQLTYLLSQRMGNLSVTD